MNTVAVYWTRIIVDHAAAKGLDTGPILAALGVDARQLRITGARIDAETDDAVWGRLACELADDDLAVHLAEQSCLPARFGWLGFRSRAAATLGESVGIGLRYQHALHAGRPLSVSTDRHRVTLLRNSEIRARWPRRSEVAFCSMVSYARRCTGLDVAPIEVHFQHARPSDTTELERLFRCPIAFNRKDNALIFDTTYLHAPMKTAEPELAALLDAWAPECDEATGDEDDDDIHRVIAEMVTDSTPSLTAVARRLGISMRTLQRRLAERGTSFREVVDRVRCTKAVARLERGERPVVVAERLGFSDARAFRRAFQRWTGAPPGRPRAAR